MTVQEVPWGNNTSSYQKMQGTLQIRPNPKLGFRNTTLRYG